MVRRFLFLLVVAGTSGTLGVWVGFLFAPAPGADTRAAVAAFLDEHDESLADIYSRSREVFDDAVDVVSSTVDAHDEEEDNTGSADSRASK
jgi:hypothetical protein